jgi:hypothetical protein
MSSKPTDPSLSSASVLHLPENVVFRSFAAETVMLNLETGTYHGLNHTAGRMLETLEEHPVLHDAAAAIAAEYDIDAATAEGDLLTLCAGLIRRGLLAVESDD